MFDARGTRSRLRAVAAIAALGALLLTACGPSTNDAALFGSHTSNDSPGFRSVVPVGPCGCEPFIQPRPGTARYDGSHNERVLLIGDSLMNFPATEIRRTLERLGMVVPGQVRNGTSNGAVLLNVDWISHLRSYLRVLRPTVVVAGFRGPDHSPGKAFDLSQRMIWEIKRAGAQPVWLAPPTVHSPQGQPGAIYERYGQLVHSLKGATIVDTDRWLAPGNQFWWYLRFPGEGTRNVRLDYIHTSNRADYVIAQLVAAAIRPGWGASSTAAPEAATEVPGTAPPSATSSSVPGSSAPGSTAPGTTVPLPPTSSTTTPSASTTTPASSTTSTSTTTTAPTAGG